MREVDFERDFERESERECLPERSGERDFSRELARKRDFRRDLETLREGEKEEIVCREGSLATNIRGISRETCTLREIVSTSARHTVLVESENRILETSREHGDKA